VVLIVARQTSARSLNQRSNAPVVLAIRANRRALDRGTGAKVTVAVRGPVWDAGTRSNRNILVAKPEHLFPCPWGPGQPLIRAQERLSETRRRIAIGLACWCVNSLLGG
jgi:hypothetical protein